MTRRPRFRVRRLAALASVAFALAAPAARADDPPVRPRESPFGAPLTLRRAPAPEDPPRGFHYETPPRRALMVAGGLGFGVTWLIAVGVGIRAEDGILAIPVVGPFIRAGDPEDRGAGPNAWLSGVLIADGLMQTAGIAVLLAGALTRDRVLVADRPRLAVLPTARSAPAGFTLAGSF